MSDDTRENDKSSNGEKLGWGLLRPPPLPAVVFGALYGLLAGMVIAYDIVVLFRLGKALVPKLKERVPFVGSDED